MEEDKDIQKEIIEKRFYTRSELCIAFNICANTLRRKMKILEIEAKGRQLNPGEVKLLYTEAFGIEVELLG